MTYLDLETAIQALGEGVDPIESLSLAFGVPQCLIDIGKSAALALLPSSIVLNISDSVAKGRQSASEDIAYLKKKILLENGIFEIDTENGTFRFASDFSRAGLDSQGQDAIGKLAGLSESLAYALQAGSELYNNYKEVEGIIYGISDCLDSYRTFLRLQKGFSSEMNSNPLAAYELEMAKMQVAVGYINDFDEVTANCRKIILDRLANPELEPVFANADLVSGLGFLTSDGQEQTQDPVFRLVFGPPKSKKGQFLLSVDGLYYDSQKGGLPSVSGYVPPDEVYLFSHNPNLGGKGKPISLKILNEYVDTIFDPNVIDESPMLLSHYAADHFLKVLEGQKIKNLYDLSGQIQTTIDSGGNLAILTNLREAFYSTAARHTQKINKRKKQIEIAVKSPSIFGRNTSFGLGEVPINDFSFLKDLNLSVAFETQRKLIFQQAEVSGIVLPLQPKFVKSVDADSNVKFDHLIVPTVGKGAIIFDEDALNDETQKATILSLNQEIVSDGLIAIYNFLDGEITYPGSDNWNVLNCNTTNNYNNAQLVGASPSSVFSEGLAIPYLRGITKSTSAGAISGVGSYVELPDNPEFQNWTYSPNGFSFEAWVHLPLPTRVISQADPVAGYGASSHFRLLLACENTGGINEGINIERAPYTNNSDIVRGMLIGFSRDRYLINNDPISTDNADNLGSDSVLFIAPTRSVNASDVGFVNKLGVTTCTSGYDVCKCAVPIFTTYINNTSTISDLLNETFVHFVFSIDVPKNEVRIYGDKNLLTTASLTDTFGVPPYTPPALPSFKEVNSFNYSTSSTGLSVFYNGPQLNQYFTPWILGGGYTDGNKDNSHFMGSNFGNFSGLKGYVGSVKFYNKPLTTEEVGVNYDAQQGFFKNIDI